ncbi:uncharacterized protein [Penaeus vannamei]|uniref:uncharacterized protein n=1 Tax=Penaeus vannamei TaxID=6689 RepID=UPI00387F3A75
MNYEKEYKAAAVDNSDATVVTRDNVQVIVTAATAVVPVNSTRNHSRSTISCSLSSSIVISTRISRSTISCSPSSSSIALSTRISVSTISCSPSSSSIALSTRISVSTISCSPSSSSIALSTRISRSTISCSSSSSSIAINDENTPRRVFVAWHDLTVTLKKAETQETRYSIV